MNISIRLFAGFFLVVGLAGWFVLNIINHEIEPGIRQATEETLVDTANMLAELAAEDMATKHIADGRFARAVAAAGKREPDASIFGISKDSVDFRVYVTDAKGIVRFDTEPGTLGADYSQWRDVAKVLRGEYGARSTREDPDDPHSSAMYVAAPILEGDKLIGVLTVAKPTSTVLPYVARAESRVKRAGGLLLAISTLIGVVFTLWLALSINRLRSYARAVAEGRKVPLPTSGGSQFAELAKALATMRERLDGKQYVEAYVQNLAHEMKSPLSAITASAELLQEDLPTEERRRFSSHVAEQAQRLRRIIDRMLSLAHLEQLQEPGERKSVDLAELLSACIAERRLALSNGNLDCKLSAPTALYVEGDPLLLQQACLNLIDNAIEFSPAGDIVEIELRPEGDRAVIEVRDHGAGAPDYALPQLFDRFYSLPRPATGKKSTGLGLALVREIAHLHGGEATFANHPQGGGLARLSFACRR